MIPDDAKDLNRVGPFSAAYFFEEWHRFREVMCSREFTTEQKGTAFGALFLVSLNIDPMEPMEMQNRVLYAWEVVASEFSRRNAMELLRPLRQRRVGT